MAEAKRDENRITTLLAVSDVDGKTPTPVYANPVTHAYKVSLNPTNTGFPTINAHRDENRVTTALVETSAGDLIELYVDSENKLLIEG